METAILMLAKNWMTRLAAENEGLDMTESCSHKRMNGTPGESAEARILECPLIHPKLLYFGRASIEPYLLIP